MITNLLIAIYLVTPLIKGQRETILLTGFTVEQACNFSHNRGQGNEVWKLSAGGVIGLPLTLSYTRIECEKI